MAGKFVNEEHLREHSLLSTLLEYGSSVRAFRGYVASSEDGGKVILYPSLGDLTFSLEIDKDDIIATAPAPETLLPHGGTVVWVRPDAEIKSKGDRIGTMSARRPMGAAASSALRDQPMAAAGRYVSVTTGRLNIRLRRRVMSTCASCTCSSCETHPSCTSTCNSIATMPAVERGP